MNENRSLARETGEGRGGLGARGGIRGESNHLMLLMEEVGFTAWASQFHRGLTRLSDVPGL